jgi:hypothetical protein
MNTNRNFTLCNNQTSNSLAFNNPIYVSFDDLPQINRLTITPSKNKSQPGATPSFMLNKKATVPMATPIVNHSVKSAAANKSKLGPAPSHPPPPPPRTPPRIQTRPHMANKPPIVLRRKPSLPLYQNVANIYTNQMLEESCASLESCCSTLSSMSSQHANDINNSYQINSNSSSASSNATMIIRRSPINHNHHHHHHHHHQQQHQNQQLLSSTVNTSSELIMSDDCLLLIEDDMMADDLTPPPHLHNAIDSSSMNRTLKAAENTVVTQSLPAACNSGNTKSIASMLSPIMTSSRADLKRTTPAQQHRHDQQLRVHKAVPLFMVHPVPSSPQNQMRQSNHQVEKNTPILSMDRAKTRSLFNSLPTRSIKNTPPPSRSIQNDQQKQSITQTPAIIAHTTNSLPRHVTLQRPETILSTPPTFNNCNYFQTQLNNVSDVLDSSSGAMNTTPDESSILSASSVLGAHLPLPPSPFKSSPKSKTPIEEAAASVAPAKFHSILSLNRNKSGAQQNVPNGSHSTATKKVSFMLDAVCIIADSRNDESISSFSSSSGASSSSSSSSMSVPSNGDEDAEEESFVSYQQRSLSPSKHALCASPVPPTHQNTAEDLDLLKERIFSKIFSNEDYFFGAHNNANRIDSASATSIQSTCSSSSSSSVSSTTSSSSSGYKSSNMSSLLIQNTIQQHQDVITTKQPLVINKVTQPKPAVPLVTGTELDCFIEANRERLSRLKDKRSQLVNTIMSQVDGGMSMVPTSDADEEANSNNDDSSTSMLLRTSNSSGVSGEDVVVASENSSIDTMIIKTESARLFQKIFQSASRVAKTTSC